jgi:hypothetical protein
MPMAPFSDLFGNMRDTFIEAGMSVAGATSLTNGEMEDEDVAKHLSNHDLGVLAACLAQFAEGVTEHDEEELDDLLSSDG